MTDLDQQQARTRPIVVTDVQIPFGSMVILMVKWAIAAIPAAIILAIVAVIVSAVGGALVAALLHR